MADSYSLRGVPTDAKSNAKHRVSLRDRQVPEIAKKFVFFYLILSLMAELLFIKTKFVGRRVTRIIRPTVGR